MENIEKGIELFNQGRYWDAHAAWEKEWLSAGEPDEKEFIRGMIMAAGALHHFQKKEFPGTGKLLAKSIEALELFKEAKTVINTDDFLRQLIAFEEKFTRCRECIAEGDFPSIIMKVLPRV